MGEMRMMSVWLALAIDGRVMMKWRDEDGVLQDRSFDTEAEARTYGRRLAQGPLVASSSCPTWRHRSSKRCGCGSKS